MTNSSTIKSKKGHLSTITSSAIIPGFHCWPNPPEDYEYLGEPHRHLFYIKAEVWVSESRQIEFIEFAAHIKNTIDTTYNQSHYDVNAYNFEGRSCEQIAMELMLIFQEEGFSMCLVSVSEDNENGATVYAI